MFPCFVIGLVLLLLLPTHQIISSTLLITTPTPSLVKTSLKGILLSLRKPRENIQVCHNVSPTSYRQVTDILPTHYQLSPDCRWAVSRLVAYISGKICWPSVGRLSANSRLTVGRHTADSRPTVDRQVFWGGLLHNYQYYANPYQVSHIFSHLQQSLLLRVLHHSSRNASLFPQSEPSHSNST